MKVDYMKKVEQWKQVKITDGTHIGIINHIGQRVPTFKNMERRLIKELRSCR